MNAGALDVPDLPRWVYAHGIAAEPAHWRRALGAGYALGHDRARLAALLGAVDPERVLELPAALALLIPAGRDDVLGALERVARPVERVLLHTLADEPPEHDGATTLPDDAPLPGYLAAELEWARTRGPVWCVYVDGEPASFAYAPWRSGAYFDIAVDTVPSARQLGLATIVASALIHAERAHDRQPVWGAASHDHASLRLARRLGFTPTDEIWLAPSS